MRGFAFVFHCLIKLFCCLICATGRQLLRPAMSGSRAARAKENFNKTVTKNAANGILTDHQFNCNTLPYFV